MPGPLKNPRHEAFARELAKGKTQHEAYEAAGYKPDAPHASRLASSGNVLARVAELQGKVAQKLVVTVASLIEKAEECRVAAMAAGQHSAVIAAIKEIGVLAGVRIEKRDTTHRHVDQLTDAELCAILAEDSGFDIAAKAPNPEKLN